MKSNFFMSIVITTFTVIVASAQTDFYYTFSNKKVMLTKIADKYLAEFPTGLDSSASVQISLQKKLFEKTYITTNHAALTQYGSAVKLSPTFLTPDGLEINYTHQIVLKLLPNSSAQAVSQLVTANNLTLIKSTTLYDLYSCTSDALEVSRNIYESGLVLFCTPDLISTVEKSDHIPNDTYFSQQWYLHNTGQGTNDDHTTTVNADIDAPAAWDITLGNSNITIAVIDDGVVSNHPDLPNTRQVRLNGSNFASEYDGSNNPDDPSPNLLVNQANNHGTACAGIIAATQDNNEGISGIAPYCKIMPVKIPYGSIPSSIYADAIDFAVNNNADILSCSWGYYSNNPNFIPVIVSALQNAADNDKTIVFSAGNYADRANGDFGGYGFVAFPACSSVENLLAVGASDRNNSVANYSPNGITLDIVAPSQTASDWQISGEGPNIWTTDIPGTNAGYNPWIIDEVGIPALGEYLPASGQNFDAYTGRMGGTSASAPQVAAVAALIKSVNPCATAGQIKDILLAGADRVGDYNYSWSPEQPKHSKELGYGKLNAFNAVQIAQGTFSPTVDLMVKDSPDDTGVEPNLISQYMWNSQDIWVRNTNDGDVQGQNPEYSPTVPNYVYVRVTNKSCVNSTGNEQLTVYWSKAGTSLSWPHNWDGSYLETPIEGNPPVTMGAPVGTVTIPSLAPGEETVLTFEWIVPNGDDYIWINPDPWHFCLLARIESVEDPNIDTTDLYTNVQNNNNQAWRNVTIVDIVQDIATGGDGNIGGVISVGNPFNEPRTFYLEMEKEDIENGKAIFDEAEVSIKMDQKLYAAWERGGKESQKLENTLDQRKKIIKGNNVILDNILFNANESGTMGIRFNFLTKEITDKTHYKFHVIQRDGLTGAIIGGETYEIKKQARPIFIANPGGDKEVNKNEIITIYAEQINEAAIYNWYDMDGNLVYQGKDLTVAADVTKKFKLEIIAISDGYKDYAEVSVNLKPNLLESITPNPASNNVSVNYKINDAISAYIMIIGIYGGPTSSNNYILDLNNTQTNIDISAFANGLYTVALICNGEIVDAKTLLKQ